jgi:hypothetical protein
MMPSMTGPLYKLRATRSDITHKNKALDKKLKDGEMFPLSLHKWCPIFYLQWQEKVCEPFESTWT